MIEWKITDGLTDYQEALAIMEERVEDIRLGRAGELIWLLEHPALYTAGTSAKPEDLLRPDFLPVIHTGRGGEFTYHGPGQRVVYVMIDLRKRARDIRRFVRDLEDWIIRTLAAFHIKGLSHEDRVGVWIERPEKPLRDGGAMSEDKIAAIGIRLRKWISFHGLSINIDPNLDHYSGIAPCGLRDYGVTSFVDLGYPVSFADVDSALRHACPFFD